MHIDYGLFLVVSYNDIEGAKDVKELTHFAKPPCIKDSDTPESYSGCSSKRENKEKKKDVRNWK